MEGEIHDPEGPVINDVIVTQTGDEVLQAVQTAVASFAVSGVYMRLQGGFRVVLAPEQDRAAVQTAITSALAQLESAALADQAAIDESVALLQQILAKPKANRSPIENIVVGFGKSIPDIRNRTR